MIALGGPRRGLGAAVAAVMATAWGAALVAQEVGGGTLLHAHHHVADEGGPLWLTVLLPPFWVSAVLFLAAWQIMIAAMMLPSSLPLVRLFAQVAFRRPAPYRTMAAFLAGYAVVWSAFGAAAFAGDVVLHRTVGSVSALGGRPWLLSAGVLIGAGAFQFTDLKDRCLDQCRHPGPFLMRHYRRGAAGAYALGRRHGLFCMGCCWALMLLMVVAGVANLLWMAGLAAVTYYEKAGRHRGGFGSRRSWASC